MKSVISFIARTFYTSNLAALTVASMLVACQAKAFKPVAGVNPIGANSSSLTAAQAQVVQAQALSGGLSFTFVLDEPCKTSAGVFANDGTLVRTLWSKVRYPAGTNSAVWDGLDDNGNTAASGIYVVKLLQHNTEYVWEGAIGNTSGDLSGPTVHHGFWPMKDMAISGTNGFYVSGYNEGSYDFRNFLTTDPQRVRMAWYWVYQPQFNKSGSVPGDVNDLNWLCAAADNNRIYFASSGTPNPANLATPNAYPGCVVACNVGDNSPAYFANGVQILNNGANSPLPSGVYVGTQPGLSGLSVQQNGNLLAVSVAPDNRVYLLDKVSGAALGSFAVTSPGRLSFSPDGSLWVISGNTVVRYINPGTTPTAALTIANLGKPLALAVNPSNPNIIIVADGGASQQLKAFDSAGTALWVYGQSGGYQVNGAAVATDKFWFFDGENDATFLCFATDGSFWVGDEGNYRCLHFSGSLSYIEQIMYQPHSYMACVDQNNPSRVFSQFLEFSVDYTKPLPQAWTLVNNWRVNVDPVHISWNEGLREVTTFPNGHTYALIDNNSFSPAVQELCELGPNQLRFTGMFPFIHYGWTSLGPDGSARATSMGVPTWHESLLNGFDANNNPVWGSPTLMATAPQGSTDPVPRCCSFGNPRATVSSNNILISFDQSLNNGWHLGGIRLGDNKWLWKASPAGSYLNGAGVYEISNGVTYAGNTVQAVDRQVIYGYHGEFFRGQGQACQVVHFYDDGLFVGQFGEATPGHPAYEDVLPAKAANMHCPSLTKTATGDYYVWVNDEAAHGPQRWHFVNARNIREQIGSATLGSSIVLSNQWYDFPTGVTGSSGSQSGVLSWQPVSGATSYNIRYSIINGGPYTILAGSTASTHYSLTGLVNGQTYYVAVSAVRSGTEGSPSEQVEIRPFDTNQTVLKAGHMMEAGQFTPVIEVSSNALSRNQPSWVGAEHLTGVLNLRELAYYGYGNLWNQAPVGTKGYVLYSWAPGGVSIANVSPTFTVTTGSGWADVANLERQYRLDGVLGVNHGWAANPVGTIYIAPVDDAFHVLTVVSPSQFNNPRNFSLGITSTNSTTAQYTISENPGYSHVFQFLFRGNITLWANATGGSDGIVQALFLDDAPAMNSAAPLPPIATTTTLSSSQNPAPAGGMVTFTATVAGAGGTPSGLVTFYDSTNSLGTATLNNAGQTSFSTAALSANGSPHAISAGYSGDNIFGPSSSSILSQAITNPVVTTPPPISSGNGLVVSYSLASNGSDSQSGNNLTLVGSPGFGNGAITWNGALPTVGYSSPQQWPQSGLTVATWINMNDPNANYSVASCYGNASGSVGAAYMQFFTFGGSLMARVVQSTDVNYIGRSTPAVLSSGWHFVAFTWSGGTSSSSVKIYVDGTQQDNADNSRGTFKGPYSGSDVPLGLGAQLSCGYGMGGKFYGSQRAVQLYNRALSTAEIGALYSNNGLSSPSTTTLSASANPAPVGTAITFTATVSGSGGIPTGSVGFFDGSTNLGNSSLTGSGTASLTTSTLSLSASPHLITAVYNGDSAFAGSTSSVLSQVISPAPVITNKPIIAYALSSNGSDAQSGNNLTLVGSPGFSNGAITWDGAVPTIGYSSPQQWPQSGLTVATWINMNDPNANYSVASCYGNASGSVGAAYMQFFTSGGSLSARVIQNTDANYIGRSTPAVLSSGWHFVGFTWSGGTSSSSVKIYVDGTQQDNADNSRGTFKGPYAGSDVPLGLGAQLSCGFGMGGKFYGSQRAVQLYNRALSAAEVGSLYSTNGLASPSTTVLSSSANPTPVGAPITFTATVSGSGGTPTGSVGFFDGSTSIGSANLTASGTASLTISGLSLGGSPHLITASYGGDSAFVGSMSSVLSQVVSAPPAITNGLVVAYALSSNGNDSQSGNNLTLVGSPVFSNGAIAWNGAAQTIAYSSPQQWPQSGLTVAAWINMNDPNANYSVASCYGNASGSVGAAYMQFFTSGGSLSARVIQNTDANYIGRSTPAVLSSGWHFVGFTWSGGTNSGSVKIYVDGTQQDNADNSRGTFKGPYAGSDVPLGLGAQLSCGFGMGGKFYGSQRGVRLYNRALSSSEVNSLYISGP